MRLVLVPIAASGPLTFRCGCCLCLIVQDDVHEDRPHWDRHHGRGKVYADLDGEPFKDYYCTECKAHLEAGKRHDG